MNSAVCFVVSYALNAAWQVPLLAGAGMAAVRILRRWGPHPQHMAWVATLLLSSITPALTVVRAILPKGIFWVQNRGAGSTSAVLVGGSWTGPPTHPGTFLLPNGLIWVIFGLYASTLAYFAARLVRSLASAKALVREAAPLQLAAAAEDIWEQARRAFGIANVSMLSSESVHGIVTTGLRRPAIILSTAFARQCTEEDDLLSAFGHELAHVRREDYARNLLYECTGLLTAFHPVSWLVKAQIARTRELICDAMAVEKLIDRRRYRQSLLRMAERMVVSGAAVQALGLFDANILEERIVRMKSMVKAPTLLVRCGLTAAVTALLLGVAIGGTAVAKGVAASPADQGTNTVYTPGPDVLHPLLEAAPGPEFPGSAKLPVGIEGADKVYTPGGDVKPPGLKFAPNPEFPSAAKLPAGIESAVCVVGVVVSRDGLPEDVHVVRSAGKMFDENAMKAVRQYRFEPAQRHGHPVAVAVRIEVNFRKH